MIKHMPLVRKTSSWHQVPAVVPGFPDPAAAGGPGAGSGSAGSPASCSETVVENAGIPEGSHLTEK